jgi:hypothetical protein
MAGLVILSAYNARDLSCSVERSVLNIVIRLKLGIVSYKYRKAHLILLVFHYAFLFLYHASSLGVTENGRIF